MKTKFFLIVIFSISYFLGLSQDKYPKDIFISPIDFNMKLSGTFGELRNDHFHSGIDIKTGEVTGKNIYAIADGYISRIKIKPGGYGKALYVTHYNGYTSVYGHLEKFSQVIDSFARKIQYENKSYDLDLYLKPDEFIVKQGEVIAISGNSGFSGGPHLHFEIRETDTQIPVNPLLFNYSVEDITPPVINLLKVYPLDWQSLVAGKNQPLDVKLKNANHKYSPTQSDTIKLSGKIYFGVNTYDPFNDWKNKNGVYRIQIYLDGELYYEHDLEKFSFDESRYINSLIDFEEKEEFKRSIQKSYIQPNNHLSIYRNVKNNGVFEFLDNNVHEIRYIISDIVSNSAELKFYVMGESPKQVIIDGQPPENDGFLQLFFYDSVNYLINEDISFKMPINALYEDLKFNYSFSESKKYPFGIFHIHNNKVPIQKWCELKICLDSIPKALWDKSVIVRINNDKIESYHSRIENNFIVTDTREFGDYSVLIDTIPPQIELINLYNGKNISNQSDFKINVLDDLSGIKSYYPTLNGNWIIMENDAKNDRLIYNFDEYLPEGKMELKIKVTDMVDNETQLMIQLMQ